MRERRKPSFRNMGATRIVSGTMPLSLLLAARLQWSSARLINKCEG